LALCGSFRSQSAKTLGVLPFARAVPLLLVTRDMLQAAQQHPEDYRDLIVRVSGYSAHFTDLEQVVQDDIIACAEQPL